MSRIFEVVETFEVTGRGLVVVLPVHASELPHETPFFVSIRASDLPPLHAKAFHELILRRSAEPPESSALLLPGIVKAQVPIGSVLEVLASAPDA